MSDKTSNWSFRCQERRKDKSRLTRTPKVQPHAGSKKPSPQSQYSDGVSSSAYADTGARRIEPGVGVYYLVGDDGDEGGVAGGDVGPPRHGSRPQMLLPLRFLGLLRIRWSSTQSEIGSYSDGVVVDDTRRRRSGGDPSPPSCGLWLLLHSAGKLPGGPGPTWPA
jgi:hypothetical protein